MSRKYVYANAKDAARVRRLHKAGKSQMEIMRRTGIPTWRVRQYLDESSISRRRKQKITPEMAQQICELRAEGKTYRQIVDATGVSFSAVYRRASGRVA